MKYWASCCVLMLSSGCFIPTEWRFSDPPRMRGILLQSPIEIGHFERSDLPWPWCPTLQEAMAQVDEQLQLEREIARLELELQQAREQPQGGPVPTESDPVEQATHVGEWTQGGVLSGPYKGPLWNPNPSDTVVTD